MKDYFRINWCAFIFISSLPDITEIPTVIELPATILDASLGNSLESIIIDGSPESYSRNENQTIDVLESTTDAVQKGKLSVFCYLETLYYQEIEI